jgi:UDP-N-acetylmuramoylalanine--D-glutamate ligase
VAITGSNGKTTTTTLLGKIFSDAGLPALVGGNIGLPVIDLVAKSTQETKSVLEVSSFQLETVEEFHPRIAVVLNITPDHLDRHGSFENYAAAKTRITKRQAPDDFLILNAEDKAAQMVGLKTKAQIYWFSGRRPIKQGAFVYGESIVFLAREGAKTEPVMPVSEIHLKGSHNVENVLAAVCAARLAGISAEMIRSAVAGFKAVEHRLELVKSVHGVEFYNDSKATNVDASMKALASFSGGIHLILGGKDKDSDYSLMTELLKERVKAVYTIGTAAEKIERQLHGVVKMVQAETMQVAVSEAAKAAVSGDVVLLSPACSSFDQFENYEHRGRVFRQFVNELI